MGRINDQIISASMGLLLICFSYLNPVEKIFTELHCRLICFRFIGVLSPYHVPLDCCRIFGRLIRLEYLNGVPLVNEWIRNNTSSNSMETSVSSSAASTMTCCYNSSHIVFSPLKILFTNSTGRMDSNSLNFFFSYQKNSLSCSISDILVLSM